MSDQTSLDFKIGIIGPSRVGKTTLIATLLRDAQRMLEGSPTRIEADDGATQARIDDHDNELQGALRSGRFRNHALKGTEEPFGFKLRLEPGNGAASLRFDVLDFPGAWVTSQLPEHVAGWKECRAWIESSRVLLVPIDATLLMETQFEEHEQVLNKLLTMAQVEKVVRMWAKQRQQQAAEPAMLLLCPVKCETYFADNGGLRNASRRLLDRVRQVYASVISAAKGEAPHVQIAYAPVDTLGCVELISADWEEDSRKPGDFIFSTMFRVIKPGELRSKGADSLMAMLCSEALKLAGERARELAEVMRGGADAAAERAERSEGFLRDIWNRFNGEKTRRREHALQLYAELQEQRQQVEALEKGLKAMANFPRDSRLEKL
jgi:hypothetical protein